MSRGASPSRRTEGSTSPTTETTIRQIRDGVVTTLAGIAGEQGLRDGRGGHARFSNPRGLTLDARGNVWVADCGNRAIRRVSPDGVVETIIGPRSAHPAFVVDIESPSSVAVAKDGTIYVAAEQGHAVWRVSPDGRAESHRGSESFEPSAVALDRDGRLYVADRGEEALYRLAFGKKLELVAGGKEGLVHLQRPYGIAFRADGSILVATEGGYMQRYAPDSYGGWSDAMVRIDASGNASRFGRTGAQGVAVDASGRVFVTTYDNDCVVEVTGAGDRIVAGNKVDPRTRYAYEQNPPRPREHRRVEQGPVTLPSGTWSIVRLPSTSAGVLGDVADIFDVQRDAELLRFEVVAPQRGRKEVLAALMAMRPIPVTLPPAPVPPPEVGERRPIDVKELSAIPEQYLIFNEDYKVEYAASENWPVVEPMLEEWTKRPSVRFRAVAYGLLYRHAHAATHRKALQTIVEDRSAPGLARNYALGALMMKSGIDMYVSEPRGWPGRDEWLLTLFSDPTLIEIQEDSFLLRPLDVVVGGDPDRWVPRVLPLLHEDATRFAAASALASLLEVRMFSGSAWEAKHPDVRDELARTIVAALIPWMNEPRLDARKRSWLVDAAGRFGMSGAIPQIRKALEDKETRDAAAAALLALTGILGDGFREEVEKRSNETERSWIYGRVWNRAPLPAEAIAAALEAWARYATTPGARPFNWMEKLPVDASIGHYASTHVHERPEIAKALVERIAQLPQRDRIVADELSAMLVAFDLPEVRAFAVARIAGEGDARLIASVLRARESFSAAELGELPAPLRAVMLRDAQAAVSILESDDADAFAWLLAAAKLTRWELPAGPLARRSGASEVVDAYLASIDTPATRALFQSRHRGEIPISGPIPDGCGVGATFASAEDALRADLREGRIREVRALFAATAGPCAYPRPAIVVRVNHDGSGELFVGGKNRVPLDRDKVRAFLERLDSIGLESLPSIDSTDGWSGRYEYFRADANGGRRLVFFDTNAFDVSSYRKAKELFGNL